MTEAQPDPYRELFDEIVREWTQHDLYSQFYPDTETQENNR